MDQNIRKILEDLYELEPQLKNDEARLIEIVSKLALNKPNAPIDQNFVLSLRQQLIGQANTNNLEIKNGLWESIINSFNMKKFNLALGGVAIVVLLVATGVVYLYGDGNKSSNKVSYDNSLKITQAQEQAFGKLSDISITNGGQGGGNAANATGLPMAEDVARGSGTDAKMIAPPGDYPIYRYVYNGEELSLTEDKLEVLKRQKGNQVIGGIDGLLNTMSFGLVNIGSFSNLRLQSANFVQDGGDGYNIYVNADEGTININGAYPVYAMSSVKPCFDTGTGNCASEVTPVQISEIPSDDELISIANNFVNQHSIPTSAYGMPIVQDEWRRIYELATDKTSIYIPDQISVVYPLEIEGQAVFDESGYRSGLQVAVNVRNKKVTSVYDLTVQNYESSMYDAETDVKRILDVANRGGMYGYYMPEGGRIVDVELGTPTLQYVKMWNYNYRGIGINANEELLIPSLIFPILEQPANEPYFRKSVVVPLIKDILDRNNGFPGDIMPLVKDLPVTTEPAEAR